MKSTIRAFVLLILTVGMLAGCGDDEEFSESLGLGGPEGGSESESKAGDQGSDAKDSELAIDTGPYATTDFRLHPSLVDIAQMYRDGEATIVRIAWPPKASGGGQIRAATSASRFPESPAW